MYRSDENRNYIFDGDLEQYLLSKGVESGHIEKMKHKILQHDKEVYYESKYLETGKFERETMLVPLSKVIGTSRGTVGKSVFENVRTMSDGEREPSRFQSCLSFLDKMTLEELRASYEKLYYPVEMEYYKEEDEYFLTSDGNHRTLTAMLLGAEFIKANVTTMYCNFVKRDKCLAVEKFYKDFDIIQINYAYNGAEIVFADNDTHYVVSGFPRRINENCYEYINKLSDEIQKDMKAVKTWMKLPKLIRDILGMFCSNKRIIQYIEKQQNYHWDRSIDIYDFD